MRPLSPSPRSILDPQTAEPNAGSFRGGLPRIDLAPLGKGPLFRFVHHKRWLYAAIAAEDLFLGMAIVHLGYIASFFSFAFDRRRAKMLVDRSFLAPPPFAEVFGAPSAGFRARFVLPPSFCRASIERGVGESAFKIELRVRDMKVSARLASEEAPPPISAIVPLGGPRAGLLNATEKGALLSVKGEAILAGRRYSLDGGFGGYDFTRGYLPRHTTWRWAFALGRAASGERVGLNLVEGFSGEPECALWIDGELFPVAEGRFTFDPAHPLEPWIVRSADSAVELRFDPSGMHAERKDFGVIASRFLQPVGSFSGVLRPPGRAPLSVDRLLGVVEEQDVLW